MSGSGRAEFRLSWGSGAAVGWGNGSPPAPKPVVTLSRPHDAPW